MHHIIISKYLVIKLGVYIYGNLDRPWLKPPSFRRRRTRGTKVFRLDGYAYVIIIKRRPFPQLCRTLLSSIHYPSRFPKWECVFLCLLVFFRPFMFNYNNHVVFIEELRIIWHYSVNPKLLYYSLFRYNARFKNCCSRFCSFFSIFH